MAQPDNFSLYPAAGHRRRCGWPRAGCAVPAARSWRPACSPGSRRSPATTACSCSSRSASSSRGIAGARGGRTATGIPRSRSRPRSARVAVFALVMAPWWARQLAVFGSLSPSTASGKVLFIRDIGEWNSITTPASLEHLLGMGIGPLIATRVRGARRGRRDLRHARLRARPRPADAHRRLGAPALDGLRAVLRLRRDPVRVLGARLGRPRAGRHVHPFGGRARAVRLHPGARRARPRDRLGRGPTPDLGRRDAPSTSSVPRRSPSRSVAAVLGSALRPPVVGRPGATSSRPSPRRSTRPAPRRATG